MQVTSIIEAEKIMNTKQTKGIYKKRKRHELGKRKINRNLNLPHRLPFRFYTLWNRKKHSCFPRLWMQSPSSLTHIEKNTKKRKRSGGTYVYQLELEWSHVTAWYPRIRPSLVITFSEFECRFESPQRLARQTEWERHGEILWPAQSHHWLTNSNQMQIPNLWISRGQPPHTPPPSRAWDVGKCEGVNYKVGWDWGRKSKDVLREWAREVSQDDAYRLYLSFPFRCSKTHPFTLLRPLRKNYSCLHRLCVKLCIVRFTTSVSQ